MELLNWQKVFFEMEQIKGRFSDLSAEAAREAI
jgi:hypothetical protein